jgi:hypothetical protein
MTWENNVKFLLLFLLLPLTAKAYTLNNSIGARFDNENVNVRVGLNPTPCAFVDLDEVASLLNEAMDGFWNKVSTSRLQLKTSGSENTGDDRNRPISRPSYCFLRVDRLFSINCGCLKSNKGCERKSKRDSCKPRDSTSKNVFW